MIGSVITPQSSLYDHQYIVHVLPRRTDYKLNGYLVNMESHFPPTSAYLPHSYMVCVMNFST